MKDFIALKGRKNKWSRFTKKLKKESKTVWGFLEPVIDTYLKNKSRRQNGK